MSEAGVTEECMLRLQRLNDKAKLDCLNPISRGEAHTRGSTSDASAIASHGFDFAHGTPCTMHAQRGHSRYEWELRRSRDFLVTEHGMPTGR